MAADMPVQTDVHACHFVVLNFLLARVALVAKRCLQEQLCSGPACVHAFLTLTLTYMQSGVPTHNPNPECIPSPCPGDMRAAWRAHSCCMTWR